MQVSASCLGFCLGLGVRPFRSVLTWLMNAFRAEGFRTKVLDVF